MRSLIVLCAAVVATVVILGLTPALYSQQTPEAKIGVVDFYDISQGFKVWARIRTELGEEKVACDKLLAEMAAEIGKLEQEVKQYEPGTEQHEKIQIMLNGRKIARESFFMRKQKELDAKSEKFAKEVLGQVNEAIEKYGRENNFTIIVKKEELPAEMLDTQQLIMSTSQNFVMYYDRNIDITDKIIAILNEKHGDK